MKCICSIIILLFGLSAFAQKPVLVVPRGHSENISQLITTADDKYLLSAAWDKTIRVWDLASGKELKSIEGFKSWVGAMAISPDGDHFAAGAQKDFRIYSMKEGFREIKKDTSTDNITAVTYSPDGTEFATAEQTFLRKEGYYVRYVKTWSAATMTLRKSTKLYGEGDISQLKYMKDGSIAVLRNHNYVRINGQTGVIIKKDSIEDYSRKILSPDGKYMVTEGFENQPERTAVVTIKELSSGRIISTLKGHTSSIKSLAYSPEGHYLATGADDATIIVWDLQRNALAWRISGFKADTWSLSFNAAGDKLISGNTDDVIRVWDFKTQQLLTQMGGYANNIQSLALDPSGKKLFIGGNNNKNSYLSLLDLKAGNVSQAYDANGIPYKNKNIS